MNESSKIVSLNLVKNSPPEVIERSIWACNCDCITFKLYDDGTAVCAKCSASQTGVLVNFNEEYNG